MTTAACFIALKVVEKSEFVHALSFLVLLSTSITFL